MHIFVIDKSKNVMIKIQKATITDCPIIQSIANIAFRNTYESILSKDQIDYMMEWMYSTPSLHKQMLEEGHIYYIAFDTDRPVGYVSIQQENNHLFHLQKIYVLPQEQGKHIGKLLFERAINAIKELHPSPCKMELNVNRNNSAIEFYEKMGMKNVRQGDFHIGNGFYMNDYIMQITIQ